MGETSYRYHFKIDEYDYGIQRCNSYKDLGVIFDTNLTFKEHPTI